MTEDYNNVQLRYDTTGYGVDGLLYVLGIVALVMAVPITEVITKYKERTLKIKAEIIREEIALEKLKQQNFIIETEKMKLELEKMRLAYTPNQNDIRKI